MGKIGVDEKGPIQVSHLQWDPRASHPPPLLVSLTLPSAALGGEASALATLLAE